jgi:hypothetical protein
MNIEAILEACEGAALLPPKLLGRGVSVTLPNEALRVVMRSPENTLAILAEVRRLRQQECEHVDQLITRLSNLRKGALALFSEYESLRANARLAAEDRTDLALEELRDQLDEMEIPSFCPAIDPCAACQRNEEIEEWMVTLGQP